MHEYNVNIVLVNIVLVNIVLVNIVLVNIVSYLCRGIFRVLIQYQPKHHLEIVTSYMFIFRLVQRMNRSPRTS